MLYEDINEVNLWDIFYCFFIVYELQIWLILFWFGLHSACLKRKTIDNIYINHQVLKSVPSIILKPSSNDHITSITIKSSGRLFLTYSTYLILTHSETYDNAKFKVKFEYVKGNIDIRFYFWLIFSFKFITI